MGAEYRAHLAERTNEQATDGNLALLTLFQMFNSLRQRDSQTSSASGPKARDTFASRKDPKSRSRNRMARRRLRELSFLRGIKTRQMARWWHGVASLLVIALGACGGAPYPKSTESMRQLQMTKVNQRPVAGENEAMLVFMRSSSRFNMVSAAVFDVSDEKTKFLGVVNAGTKVMYRAQPGAYTFMVMKVSSFGAVPGEADFMRANVLSGRTYYASVVPYTIFPGQAGFSLRPVRSKDASGSEFSDAENSTHFVVNSQTIERWSPGFEDEGHLKRAEQWPRWGSRSAEERAARTLNSEDGRM